MHVSDFADLFPDRNTMEGPFTVITLSQHTENDMTMWSMEVESEREALLETVSSCSVPSINLCPQLSTFSQSPKHLNWNVTGGNAAKCTINDDRKH